MHKAAISQDMLGPAALIAARLLNHLQLVFAIRQGKQLVPVAAARSLGVDTLSPVPVLDELRQLAFNDCRGFLRRRDLAFLCGIGARLNCLSGALEGAGADFRGGEDAKARLAR